MGVLDKLMFWKPRFWNKDEPDVPLPEPGYEVEGCFTLPDDQTPEDLACEPSPPVQGPTTNRS